MTDTFALPYAERLLSCLCEALQATTGGEVCRCCLYPGIAPPPADSCCNCPNGSQGQASVQVTDLFPTQRFPARGLSEATACRAFGWGAELTMTVYRCVPVPAEDGTPPDCAELTAATGKILDDAQAMLAAILCCDWNPDKQPMIPGNWHPLPNRGGCGGGTMTVTVYLGGRCCATEL